MKFLVDNNLPPAWGPGLSELSKPHHHAVEVVALRQKFPHDARDDVWISALGTEMGWCVLSQDRFGKGDIEREALRQAKLIVFRLQPQWAKHSYWPKTQALLRWWPSFRNQAKLLRSHPIVIS